MPMDIDTASWPEKEDYDLAMEDLSRNVHDQLIKYGKLAKDGTGILRPGGAGLYVTLYRVDNWIVRCFCRDDSSQRQPPSDIVTRYQYISNFCDKKTNLVPALVPVTYVPDAIDVDFLHRKSGSLELIKTDKLPFVRMPFIDGRALGNFIAANYKYNAIMQSLCDAWISMIRDLETVHMAHGDLDLTNVIVTTQGPSLVLKLIDYDNTWVPELGPNRKQTEAGHEHFQHPALHGQNRYINAEMDRFPALSIYISLKVLSIYPDLYEKLGADIEHRLLLSSADYKAEMQSTPNNNITYLRTLQNPELDPLLNELTAALREKRQPQSLSQLLAKRASQPIADVTPAQELNNGQTPSSFIDDEGIPIVYTDWGTAKYFKAENEPLVPTPLDQPVRPQPANPWLAPQLEPPPPVQPANPWSAPSPVPPPPPWADAQQYGGWSQQQQAFAPYPPANQYQQGSRRQLRNVILGIAIPIATVLFILALFYHQIWWIRVVFLLVIAIIVLTLFVSRRR